MSARVYFIGNDKEEDHQQRKTDKDAKVGDNDRNGRNPESGCADREKQVSAPGLHRAKPTKRRVGKTPNKPSDAKTDDRTNESKRIIIRVKSPSSHNVSKNTQHDKKGVKPIAADATKPAIPPPPPPLSPRPETPGPAPAAKRDKVMLSETDFQDCATPKCPRVGHFHKEVIKKVSNAEKRIIAKTKTGPVCRPVRYTLVESCECNDHAHMTLDHVAAKLKVGQSFTIGETVRGQPDVGTGGKANNTRGAIAEASIAASLENSHEDSLGKEDSVRELEETEVTPLSPATDFKITDPGQGASVAAPAEPHARKGNETGRKRVTWDSALAQRHQEPKTQLPVATLGRYLLSSDKVTSPPGILKATERRDIMDKGGRVVLGYRTFTVNMQGFKWAIAKYLHGLKVDLKEALGVRLEESDVIPRGDRITKIVLVDKVRYMVLTTPRVIPQQISSLLSWQSSFMRSCSEITVDNDLLFDSFNYFVYLMIIQAMVTGSKLKRFKELETLPIDVEVFADAQGEGIQIQPGCKVVEAKASAPVQSKLSPLVKIGGRGYHMFGEFPRFNTRGTEVKDNNTLHICGFERNPESQKVLFTADVAASGLTRFCGYKKSTFLINKAMLTEYFPASDEFMARYKVKPYANLPNPASLNGAYVAPIRELARIYRAMLIGTVRDLLDGNELVDTEVDEHSLNKQYIEDTAGPKLEMRRRVLAESLTDTPIVKSTIPLQIKDEITKPAKAARLVASVSGHGWLVDQPALVALLKKAFCVRYFANGTHLRVTVVNGQDYDAEETLVWQSAFETTARWLHFDILEPVREYSGTRTIVKERGQMMERLMNHMSDVWSESPDGNGTITCTACHGDDIWSSRVADNCPVPIFGELDISSCDASHVTGTFNLFDDIARTAFPDQYTGAAVARCASLFTMPNPENADEYITIEPFGLILPSGSVLTTPINTMASRWICFVYSQMGPRGLPYCGYEVTSKFTTELSSCSFLGCFFYYDDAEVPRIRVGSDPAILLRTFGSMSAKDMGVPRSVRSSPDFRKVVRMFTDEKSQWLWFNCIQRVKAMVTEGEAMYLQCLRHAFLDEPLPDLSAVEFTALDRALISRIEGEAEQLLGDTPRDEAYLSFCESIRLMRPGAYVNSKFFAACMHNKYGEKYEIEL